MLESLSELSPCQRFCVFYKTPSISFCTSLGQYFPMLSKTNFNSHCLNLSLTWQLTSLIKHFSPGMGLWRGGTMPPGAVLRLLRKIQHCLWESRRTSLWVFLRSFLGEFPSQSQNTILMHSNSGEQARTFPEFSRSGEGLERTSCLPAFPFSFSPFHFLSPHKHTHTHNLTFDSCLTNVYVSLDKLIFQSLRFSL